jgi:hypothetical protein
MSIWIIEVKQRHDSEFHIRQPYYLFKNEERARKACVDLNERAVNSTYRVAEYINFDIKPSVLTIMEPQLTLRDQFAMAAMLFDSVQSGMIAAAYIAQGKRFDGAIPGPEEHAQEYYATADKMLEARK